MFVPALALLSAVFIVGLDQLVRWKYGTAGIVGLMLLTIGIKAKNPTLGSVGTVVPAMLLAGPVL
ncbi:hypothetical protein C1I97_11505 [Streptomyces sp. NTH33]|uniref:hypothetical protein n=1 Tax=Streptomyces sp. NTH33 TaxID=1735453 RepID=UPI000DAA7399|nr:hypothetical protein [Streptomyces sp. NTH33]PZH13375.1 hypothetical protein C1I97_11505 [Streptomyces sp. NTH33]